MSGINNMGPGTGPFPDGLPSARAEALRKLQEQRKALEQAQMPDDLKKIRDTYLRQHGGVHGAPGRGQLDQQKSGSLGKSTPAGSAQPNPSSQEPKPFPVQPKYGLPAPVDKEGDQLPLQPMYGLPTPQEPEPFPVQPKYGLPAPVDKEGDQLPLQPMYGLPSPTAADADAVAEAQRKAMEILARYRMDDS
ncbi:MAG: hypothetical protein VKO21_04830 [Candidatus Sericytochromatia bacterium]|nr:hypothetical protein [Candidatus Sericytochromatia bacterium]